MANVRSGRSESTSEPTKRDYREREVTRSNGYQSLREHAAASADARKKSGNYYVNRKENTRSAERQREPKDRYNRDIDNEHDNRDRRNRENAESRRSKSPRSDGSRDRAKYEDKKYDKRSPRYSPTRREDTYSNRRNKNGDESRHRRENSSPRRYRRSPHSRDDSPSRNKQTARETSPRRQQDRRGYDNHRSSPRTLSSKDDRTRSSLRRDSKERHRSSKSPDHAVGHDKWRRSTSQSKRCNSGYDNIGSDKNKPTIDTSISGHDQLGAQSRHKHPEFDSSSSKYDERSIKAKDSIAQSSKAYHTDHRSEVHDINRIKQSDRVDYDRRESVDAKKLEKKIVEMSSSRTDKPNFDARGSKREGSNDKDANESQKKHRREEIPKKSPRGAYSDPKKEEWSQTWKDVLQKHREANRFETKCLAYRGDVHFAAKMVELAELELTMIGQRIQAHEYRLQQWERDGILCQDDQMFPGDLKPTEDKHFRNRRHMIDRMATTSSKPILGEKSIVYNDDIYDITPPSLNRIQESRLKQSNWGVFCNITNSVVGAGVISIPYAMSQGGFLLVVILLVLCGILTVYSMNIIIYLGHYHHANSFEELAKMAFGITGYVTLCFFQLTFSFGANCSYLLVIADTIPVVLGRMWNMNFVNGDPMPTAQTPWYIHLVTDRTWCIEIVVICILFPICIHRSFASLEKFAGMSVLIIIFCSFVILYKCIVDHGKYQAVSHGFMYDYIQVHSSLFPAMGTIAFTYVCQHQTYLVYNTMEIQCPDTFARVARRAVACSAVIILLLSVPGYIMFLESTESDLFLNFTDLSDKLIQICRLLIGINMVLTYPQEFMVARHTIQSLMEQYRTKREVVNIFQEQETPFRSTTVLVESDVKATVWDPTPAPPTASAFSTPWHVGLTIFLLASTFFIAILDRRLGDITSLTGSFGAVTLAFVLPAACHLKLGVPRKIHSRWHDTIVPWCTIVFGLTVFFLSTAASIYSIHLRHTTGK